ncbi:alpha/beta fold hydrolase [Streptomyces sp. NPDC057638]|uniref:alpha/beta fold hydrolase n=1 Tax=Streptomyces sp. NPDC057638 TaxID=3346190 RepID=UPI0036D103AF
MRDESVFQRAYDAVLERWPLPVRAVDVTTRHGRTRVHVSGPVDGGTAPPLVLLPGGGTTSLAWYATVGELARTRRVYAVDLLGDIGRTDSGAPPRNADDLVEWFDAVLDGLGLNRARVCGHSYGAWIALRHALLLPHRYEGLALLDPVNCFSPMSPRYLLRALPLALRPGAGRVLAFHRWETGAEPGDPVWREFLGATAVAHRSKVLMMRRPTASALRECGVPVLLVLAGRSRAHDPRRAAATARALLPDVRVHILPDASHHSLPTEAPERLTPLLAEFTD